MIVICSHHRLQSSFIVVVLYPSFGVINHESAMQCRAQSWLVSDASNLVSTCVPSTLSYSDCLLGCFQHFQLPTSSFQAQGANGAKLRYTGMTDVLRKTFQADGFKGLYRVSSPSYQPLHPHITAVSAFFLWEGFAALRQPGCLYAGMLTAVIWFSCCDIRILLNRICRHAWHSTVLLDM